MKSVVWLIPLSRERYMWIGEGGMCEWEWGLILYLSPGGIQRKNAVESLAKSEIVK
jgi:hypothetical protein